MEIAQVRLLMAAAVVAVLEAAGTASSGDGSGGVTAGPGGAGKQLPGFPTAELMTTWARLILSKNYSYFQ